MTRMGMNLPVSKSSSSKEAAGEVIAKVLRKATASDSGCSLRKEPGQLSICTAPCVRGTDSPPIGLLTVAGARIAHRSGYSRLAGARIAHRSGYSRLAGARIAHRSGYSRLAGARIAHRSGCSRLAGARIAHRSGCSRLAGARIGFDLHCSCGRERG